MMCGRHGVHGRRTWRRSTLCRRATDLDRAGALLRYRVARDGAPIQERPAGRFDRFRIAAIDTWCDLAPVLEPAYAARSARCRDEPARLRRPG
jgi:hypothetical protein